MLQSQYETRTKSLWSKTNIGYIPTLSLVGNTSNQYIVFWLDISTPDLLELHFTANTPEEAIKKAYEWCESNNLL